MADLISMLAAAAGSGGPTDPYFNQTTLLLHGDGTNGAQNNTFLDSSTNNFTITRNGNTTQGTFSPFSVGAGEWSNYFDGTGDYLSISDSTAFNMGSGNFTCECWIYTTNASATATFLSTAETTDFQGFFLGMTGGSFVFLADGNGSTPWDVSITAGTVVANTWTHVAGVRNGNVFTLYINGSSVGTTTQSITLTNSNNRIVVGGRTASSGQYLTGYLSNARVVKGTAVYTANFTPSTTPLTAISNTSLLTCQSNRFVDNSTNAFAITRNGDVRVTPFSPFAPSAAYSASTNGGSGYFDGTGDNLSIADNAVLDLGGNNFTIEGWFNFSASVSATGYTLIAKAPSAFNSQASFAFWRNTSNKLRFIFSTDGGATNLGTIDTTNNFTPNANEWYHLAVTRSGTTFYIFINGVSQSVTTSFTGSASSSSSIFDSTTALTVGSFNGNDLNFNGYASNIRLVNGSALYTATFTPSTSPFTTTSQGASSSEVELLLNFTNAGIFDNTGKNNLETVGNAQIDTTTKKYGTGSLEFDGDDFLKIPSSPLVEINGSDFTMEFWVRFNSVGGNAALISKYGNSAETLGGQGYVLQWVQSTAVLRLVLGNNPGGADQLYTWSWSPSINVWYHVAMTRSGTSGRAFVDGTQIGSTLTLITNDVVSPNALQIGKTHTVSQYLNGYIDDLRITKGVARYTANFTPPTAAFPNE